ncbi:MAG: spore photoproduct lyase family protein [Candidatus Brocadiia bacterium]
MYPLEPPAVYVHESVAADQRYRRRATGVVAALERPVEPVTYRDEDLPQLIQDHGLLAGRQPMGALAELADPILLFHTFRWDDGFEARKKLLEDAGWSQGDRLARALLGYDAFHWANYNLEGDPHRRDKVCRPCWRIHLQNGCVHRCLYCGFGGLLVAAVNIEEYWGYLSQIIERHPWQKTFLLDDDGDPMCLEPEHGTLARLIEYFGTLQDRYLVIHTKTWNTEWLRDLEHNGNTIIVWSLSGRSQSRLIEPRTGTTEERVEAARIAQEAGYPVRYKFKPIVPVKGWRQEAAEAVALALERTRPDVVSLCCFMWMDIDEMTRRLPEELLDPAFVRGAREAREETEPTRAKPFPRHVRAQIYDHYLAEIRKREPDLPVSLSTENFSMWKSFGPKLGFTATDYVCGCGPQSTPGARRLCDHPFRVAVRDDAGIPCTYS